MKTLDIFTFGLLWKRILSATPIVLTNSVLALEKHALQVRKAQLGINILKDGKFSNIIEMFWCFNSPNTKANKKIDDE